MRIAEAAGKTDTGRKRRRNEDSYVCTPPLFAVADGMGGAQAGEVASGLAAAALKESHGNGAGTSRIEELIQEANRRVHDRATSDAAASGMGTTITVALVDPAGSVTIGHVGDSRGYLLRDGRLEQLTDDHSLVAELVRRGELSPAEAEVHPQRSVITRALGTDPDVDVDTFSVQARPGDVFLLCSDGLSSYVDGATIEQIVARHANDLNAATASLIRAANRGGGDDNITAVLFRVEDDGADAAGEPDAPTRESVLAPDDEDTMHPEDRVAPPPPGPPPPASPPAASPPAAEPPVDTMVVPAAEVRAATAGAPAEPAPIPARLPALLVIAALVLLILVLVWWGLAH
ncbi:MAG: Stp1/IreP family PP2C-type Ser/Thr phosphatase [Gaiellaceae bacterium]